jgi:hypothetical protein
VTVVRAGAYKDRVSEAFDRFGRVPMEKQTVTASAKYPVLWLESSVPF